VIDWWHVPVCCEGLGVAEPASPDSGRRPRTVCGVTEIMSGATDVAWLVERSAELKGELLDFGHSKRFTRVLTDAVTARFGSVVVAEEEVFANFLDHFVLQHRLSDGRTILERFVRARGDLPRAERDLLLGWRDVLEGFFEVERLEGDVLVTVNLIDELTYRMRTNMGPAMFERFPPGSFLLARVVPILDEWLFTGSAAVLPAEREEWVCEFAAKTAMECPQLVFRNPQLLARAWQQQREDRAHFIQFFGSDLVVLPGAEWAERMHEYWHHCSAVAASRIQLDTAGLPAAQTMGVIYDEDEGMSFFVEFGMLREVFDDPALITQPRYRDVVRHYLDDDSISPLPLRRLAQAHPDHASQVFARLLGRPSFTWSRDGERLLRSTKADHFAQPPTPRFAPLGPRLAAAFRRIGGSPNQPAASQPAIPRAGAGADPGSVAPR